MKLNDQRVLVVGGSSGIGEATARAFAEAGATVTIASRDAARLAASKDRIGYGVSTGVMDITDDASVRAFLDSAGEFDHVVVSAAQTATGPVRGLELDDAYAAMDSKFWGAYRIARAVRIRQGGSLTFVSGFLSVRPSKNSVLQGAINAALESLARGLALELAPVRVNTVSPGLIATPLWSKIDAEARDRMYEGAAARLPAGRVGQPEDVANAVLYLASTPYATGSTVLVDGGGAIA
ncbi:MULTISPECIES: SDR family oxidoreductase [Burkholderia]|uniref:Short chain dehydrogenase n=2 Tax=Burkholderia TaxID=32008 RepID=A0A365QVN4_9BURK|nr:MULTISPECIES: SDR family oxidoreductase [Burkholderia]AIO26157.1 NAD(P)H binding domain of trans-2-enoyl-CoA reductase family protein [Burkholderia cepacia ATCC 25416]ALK22730.1 short-chain dehydrogenase [Burkholderia cepacia ATCC 25416]ASE92322.1 short chain dehydrogenase [Burkholderia cepacia]ATF79775.1 short chain dehydrogenase [Burkholderia cepacia]KVQ49877.1 short-chain dehydrogenase [Burkholderia cepacia]